jgi:hypothetical protein
MKHFIFFTLLVFLSAGAFAHPGSDSLAYQLERAKINGMLAQRAAKFGQYDQSLNMHTGIFGLQTKKDIHHSNDILMDIVKTDDEIYKQLKILLDFRTFQQTQVQTHSQEIEESTIGYMNTINKLRNQVDRLKAASQKQDEDEAKTIRAFVIALALMLVFLLFLITRRRNQTI